MTAFPDDEVVNTGQVAEADRQKFFDCLDEMRSVIGDSISENVLHEAAKSQNFDPDRALDLIFSRKAGNDEPSESPIHEVATDVDKAQQGE